MVAAQQLLWVPTRGQARAPSLEGGPHPRPPPPQEDGAPSSRGPQGG